MKKTLLTTLCALISLFGMAQTEKIYNEPYVVSVNGNVEAPRQAEITIVDNGNGTLNFLLKDFVISLGGEETSVGDVCLEGVPYTEEAQGIIAFSNEGTYTIPADRLPVRYQMLADFFVDIPYTLEGALTEEKLYAFLTIDMSKLGQNISVVIGSEDFFQPKGKIYTEPLVVIVDGNGTEPQDADVLVVTNEDGTINFVLKNFLLNLGDNEVPVGNIVVENLPVTKGEDGLDYISFSGNIFIQPGDMPGKTEEEWVGPMLSSLITDDNGNPMGIPVVLNGKMNSDKLFVTIDIELAGQVIHVQLGTDDFTVAIKGDFNGDMRVDAADAEYILTLIAGNEYSEIADFNEDNEVNAADLEFILSIIAGK